MKIPIFTSQLEKAREATDAANLRAAYATAAANQIGTANENKESISSSDTTVTITQSGKWDSVDEIAGVNPNNDPTLSSVTAGTKITVTVDASGKPVFKTATE